MMESDDGRPVFAEGKGYIALKIVAAAGDGGVVGIKADSPWNEAEESDEFFDAGSEDESVLAETPGSHYVFLFNGDKYHSASELAYRETDHEPEGDAGSFKEKVIGTFVATVDLKDGESSGLPDRCLVVLNARPGRIDDLKKSMSENDRKLPDEETVPASDAQYILAMLTRQLTDDEIKQTGSNVALFTPGGSGEKSVNYCTMSSTTYVEGERKPQTGKVRTMTDITEGLAATREEAEERPLVVHVERLSAKVEVGITGDKEEFGDKASRPNGFWQGGPQWPVVLKPKQGDKLPLVTDDYGSDNPTATTNTDWACILWGWGTNALARREYVFKNLDDVMPGADKAKTGTPFHDAREAKINTPFFANWNDAERHRSYWAVDGYYANPARYPYQYRKSYDSEQSTYWDKFKIDDGKRSSESPLFYYSYQEIRLRAMGYDPFGSTDPGENHVVNGNLEGSRRYRYIPENVLGAELLKNNIHLAASTHVIFIGQLIMGDELGKYSEELGKEQSAAVMDWVSDKYKSEGYWYDKAGYLRKAYSRMFKNLNEKRIFTDIFGENESLSTPEGPVTLSAVKGGGSPVQLDSEYMQNKVAGSADIEKDDTNPFQLVGAEIANGDGRVMLGLKEGWKLIVENSGSTRMELEPVRFKSMVYALVGYADCYRNGRMYYYSPIRHARASANLEAKDYQVGDIGVVRNHWYKINVNSVLKPGIPVEDPGQPIIPNIDPADQYLALDIHVVPWHVVDQTIDLQ